MTSSILNNPYLWPILAVASNHLRSKDATHSQPRVEPYLELLLGSAPSVDITVVSDDIIVSGQRDLISHPVHWHKNWRCLF